MNNLYGGNGFAPDTEIADQAPAFTPPRTPPAPTFLEWLSIGKLAVIAGTIAIIVITIFPVVSGK